jgi:hypothetical protein
MNDVSEHYNRKWLEMQACERLWQPFIVTRQAAEASCPDEAALHDPATRQQDAASLGLWQFDHYQLWAMSNCILRRLFAGVALIHKGQFDRLAGGFLHLFGQFLDLGTVLLVRWSDVQRQ